MSRRWLGYFGHQECSKLCITGTMKRLKPENLMMYAAGESDADMYYATRFAAPDPFLYFRIRGRSIAVLSDLEIGRARKQARVDRVLSASRLFAHRMKKPFLAGNVASYLRSLGVRQVAVPYRFPAGLVREMALHGVRITPRPDPFFPERSRKGLEEIRAIRTALRATEKAIHKAEAVLRKSRVRGKRLYLGNTVVTSDLLRKVLHVSLLEDGLTASHTIVSCGEQACDPHAEGEGPILPGRSIVMDVFPRSQRTLYWADITRTFVKGRPAPALKALYEAVREAQDAALRALREGAEGSRVHGEAVRVFDRLGYRNTLRQGLPEGFIHGTGHGVGLEIHEAPRLNAASTHRLRAREVVTVEPGLYYRGLGGVRLEDMAVVTRGGCINLTKYPKIFEIA